MNFFYSITYPYECMCAFSCRIFDENLYHNEHKNMVECPNESISVWIMLMNVWNIFHKFYIGNIVLVCVFVDVERVIKNVQNFSGINHTNKVWNQKNESVVHELLIRVLWKNICHIRYTCKYRFLLFPQLLLHRRRRFLLHHLLVFRKHRSLTTINSKPMVKANCYSIERLTDILNVRLKRKQLKYYYYYFNQTEKS